MTGPEVKALLWRLFGIELFAFFSLATLLPLNSLRYIGFSYFRFLELLTKWNQSRQNPRVYTRVPNNHNKPSKTYI